MNHTYSSFSHDVQEDIKPRWQEGLACFGKVESTDTPELDAQALQKDGKDIRHQNDEKKLESIGSSRSNIGCIIPRINISHRDLLVESQS